MYIPDRLCHTSGQRTSDSIGLWANTDVKQFPQIEEIPKK